MSELVARILDVSQMLVAKIDASSLRNIVRIK